MKTPKRTNVCLAVVSILALLISSPSGWAFSKPITYRESGDTIVFQNEFKYSPHGWQILKAINLLRDDGYTEEADLAQKYLLPMLEGVTFNDVWGDADLAGASILDYYVPNAPENNFGFGAGFLSWNIFSPSPYKNSTESFAPHPFYRYENAAEEAQFRYEYAKRIHLGFWGTDSRDLMAGWVVDTLGGQDDPQDGKWAQDTYQLDHLTTFGAGQTPATALLDLFVNHSRPQVVFPSQTEDALSTLHVPKKEVFDVSPEWFQNRFGGDDTQDIEAYSGYDGHGYAVYAGWTLDSGGNCANGDDDCAAPMIVRLPVHSKAHAWFQLGWAIHLLEDQTTPVHTSNSSYTTAQVHNDIEKRAGEVIAAGSTIYANDGYLVQNRLPAHDLAAFQNLYQFPPPPRIIYVNGNAITITCPAPDPAQFFTDRWYTDRLSRADNEGVAHAYVRHTAEITHSFLDYIECINTEDDSQWSKVGFFTAYGLDLGVKSVAGLIRQFIEDVDKTPPALTITQPMATNYPHTGTITLNWSVSDDESGVKAGSVLATLDGVAALNGQELANNQVITLLTNLGVGNHTFTVTAADNAGNAASQSVMFSIVVTTQSIIDDVNYFYSLGAITQDEATSLLKKLQAAAAYRNVANCKDSNGIYLAFIKELNAQTGKKVTAQAAAIMIADAQYLIAHCIQGGGGSMAL
jgi:hypothetical protein